MGIHKKPVPPRNPELRERIKKRRIELKLTIGECALRTGHCLSFFKNIDFRGYTIEESVLEKILETIEIPHPSEGIIKVATDKPQVKCKVSKCYKWACAGGYCSAHYQATRSASNWVGSLRMGKRLTAKQKARAQGVGTFIEPVRIFGKI